VKSTSILALSLLLAGCGTKVEYVKTKAPPHALAERPSSEVEVFMTGIPDKPFVEIGFIETQQSSAYSLDNSEAIFGKLREEAGRQGCDAVILLGDNDATEMHFAGGVGGASTLKGYRAACAVYR
jgi:hypothetical protein